MKKNRLVRHSVVKEKRCLLITDKHDALPPLDECDGHYWLKHISMKQAKTLADYFRQKTPTMIILTHCSAKVCGRLLRAISGKTINALCLENLTAEAGKEIANYLPNLSVNMIVLSHLSSSAVIPMAKKLEALPKIIWLNDVSRRSANPVLQAITRSDGQCELALSQISDETIRIIFNDYELTNIRRLCLRELSIYSLQFIGRHTLQFANDQFELSRGSDRWDAFWEARDHAKNELRWQQKEADYEETIYQQEGAIKQQDASIDEFMKKISQLEELQQRQMSLLLQQQALIRQVTGRAPPQGQAGSRAVIGEPPQMQIGQAVGSAPQRGQAGSQAMRFQYADSPTRRNEAPESELKRAKVDTNAASYGK